jgi:hypothetical protein
MCPELNTEGTSIRIQLLWPILLEVSVADAAPFLAFARRPGQDPWFLVTSLGNHVGPASTLMKQR